MKKSKGSAVIPQIGEHPPSDIGLIKSSGEDRHGVMYDGKIRRLTPKEVFRLQGFSDELYEKAQAVNSDTQLYKQGGNSVTVNVVYEIGEKLKEAEKT
jgi:site-specific DNA-cytosine methylase